MSTVNPSFHHAAVVPVGSDNGARDAKPLHRIADVRRRERVSVRSVARHMGTDVRTVNEQEKSDSDLTLSELYRWQEALRVPATEFLVDSEAPLSTPVQDRARMVRIMKTARTIFESASDDETKNMAENLVSQLIEMMPELDDVNPWHTVGQRRPLDDYGKAARYALNDDVWREL